MDLPPRLEVFFQRALASGRYRDASELVSAALLLLARRDQLRESRMESLRAALADGLAQADRGELLDGPATVAEVREALRRGRAQRRRPS